MISKARAMLRRKLVRRLNAPDIPLALERLAQQGFAPSLIFDIGAYRGEFALSALAVWPTARVACFEPLRHGGDQIARLNNPAINLHRTLVGADEKKDVPLHVAETSTSLLRDVDTDKYPVEMFPQTTVDATVRQLYAGRAPDLLKIDVQGYEMEVLKGAGGSLGRTRAILAEINLIDIHEGVPLLDEMIAWLSQRGFVSYDICGLTRRPLDNALWQTDIIFVQRDDPLRQDKRYDKTQRLAQR